MLNSGVKNVDEKSCSLHLFYLLIDVNYCKIIFVNSADLVILVECEIKKPPLVLKDLKPVEGRIGVDSSRDGNDFVC